MRPAKGAGMTDMSEATKGSLDIVREIAEEAEELDEFAASQPNLGESELFSEFAQSVFARDKIHPLMGQQVIVHGTPITPAMETDEAYGTFSTNPLAVAPMHENKPSIGTYVGLTVQSVYDIDAEADVFRIAHVIHTGSSQSVPYSQGHMQQFHFYEYVLATGSEVIPYNPVNAHSLADLRNDAVVADIDKIAFGDLADANGEWARAEEIGLFMAQTLFERQTEDDINHQRLSYLNSLGTLSEVVLVTKDFALGDKSAYETGDALNFSNANLEFLVYPKIFHFLHGYKRMRPSGAIALEREPELFIEGRLEGGQKVLAPFQEITGGTKNLRIVRAA